MWVPQCSSDTTKCRPGGADRVSWVVQAIGLGVYNRIRVVQTVHPRVNRSDSGGADRVNRVVQTGWCRPCTLVFFVQIRVVQTVLIGWY